MINFFILLLAFIGAFDLGSILTRSPSPSIPPTSVLAPPPIPVELESPVHSYRQHRPSFWRRFSEVVADFCYPRSPIGYFVVSLREPAIRTVATNYLEQAWNQIKSSTFSISPEAATKLESDLEPFAIRTLEEIQDRMTD